MTTAAPKTTEAMSAAKAVSMVKRTVVVTKPGADGKAEVTTKQVAVKAAEVLDFKDYGTHVVVVTKDGQKFNSAEQAEGAAETAEA